ncbi:glycosyltransferase family 2 protein [Globicatella sanguinis]|uniref:glycosyltransferase family 2 protein n=1 Tax=Globicatella sanguinis TaxID=13076 RepID=UPI0025433A4D|nr:glycosyltransferase family 2 protein [Globicatella sanguinis]MDK7631227.1 glycosyltransferase family 2 protein [Globicatella sanguinis]WIK66131.1 glycosyltransferase family 2 protein [Globicatella sanguinis]WKT55536.1 glycosyltransferase family 2 protein [Globicatella sanguinis]
MSKLAIVVIAFNRPKSLLRLLNSLNQLERVDVDLPLFISIDRREGIDNHKVLKVANEFEWKYGSKTIKLYSENLGLKKHVLKCGEILDDFDALVVLEDDLLVSKNLFSYVKQSVEFYKDNDNIAGISLYNHEWQMLANRPFEPVKTKYDVYLMQYAQSWGQIWLKNQWNEFIEWYKNNDGNFKNELIPKNVRNWPDTSWLKFHIKYIIEMNKYFVYPYFSFTTNFTEPGQHNKKLDTKYQVKLSNERYKDYQFGMVDSEISKYDAFFEYENLVSYFPEIDNKDLTIDLFGTKEDSKTRYILTTKILKFKIIKSYKLQLRPHEMNIIYGIQGSDIFLYDKCKDSNLKMNNRYQIWSYDNKLKSLEDIINTIKYIMLNFKKVKSYLKNRRGKK